MPLKQDKYYTMQVFLHRHYDNAGKLVLPPEEFKDLTYDQVLQTKKIVWQAGILIETSPIGMELVDPLHIKSIFFLEQPQKFAL